VKTLNVACVAFMGTIFGALLLYCPDSHGSPVAPEIHDAVQQEIADAEDVDFCLPFDLPQAIPWAGRPGTHGGVLAVGKPPLENVYAPGLYSVVVAAEGVSDQQVRLRARLDLLTSLGYFTSEPMTHVYHATEPMRIKRQTIGSRSSVTEEVVPVDVLRKPQPAMRYTLSREGWLATRGKPCVVVGRNELLEILTVELTKAGPQEVAAVQYRVGVKLHQQFQDAMQMARAFGENWYARIAPRTMKLALLRNQDGWISEKRMQAILRATRQSAGPPVEKFAQPDARTLQEALDRYVAASPSRGRACMALPSGSRVHEKAAWWREEGAGRYAAAYFDFPDMHPERGREASKGLLMLRDLERVGVSEMQPATPLVLHQPDELGGARFVLRPALHKYVSVDRSECLVYADLGFRIDWMRMRATPWSPPIVEFIGIARPERLLDWVGETGADKALPGIRAAIELGLGLRGHANLDQTGTWRVGRLEVLEPTYGTPDNWREMFAALPRVAEYRKSNARQRTPEIQAISIRSGGRADVDIKGTGRPMILHLSSSEPVEWRLKVARDARLARVIASARTRVTVIGVPKGVELQTFSADDADRGRRPGGDREIPAIHYNDGAEPNNIGIVESRLGAEVTVLQTEFGLKKFHIPRKWEPKP